MLVRIRSKDGNFRFELNPKDDVSKLVDKIRRRITISNQPRGNETPISRLKGRTLQSLGLKHGDMVFVGYKSGPLSSPPDTGTTDPSQPVWERVQEHPVDTYWRQKDGKISRNRDSRFCKHGPNGMCDYCMPVEPYDAAYQAEHSIKHLSFHAYLRKMYPKTSSSAAQALPPLTPTSYKVKVPCPSGGHPSWPAGICTACQPSPITLQSQPFRMVDHLEIASQDTVERFLQAWRATGLQRFGWLIGHYEPYEEVPMGIKGVVEAIHEPPQEGELDWIDSRPPMGGLSLASESSLSRQQVPLTIIGYIFTDLEPTAEDRTKNVFKRHSQSFFPPIQNTYPTPSKSSTTGYFGSRMVTAILSASEDGQVDISAYQVSEQACAMVEADMIEASVEPGIQEDRSHESARYVPDVFYRYKNEYGIDVKKSAKPCFPVEYLLVNVTHGFPQNPSPLFRSTNFAIENRPGLEDQHVESLLGRELSNRVELAKWLSDWHLIVFLDSTQLLSKDDIKNLIRIVTSPGLTEDSKALDALVKTEGWQTLITFAHESAPSQPRPSSTSHKDQDIPPEVFDQIAAEEAASREVRTSRIKICPHCTFENDHSGSDCEVCGLPLG
ncbi:NPL4 family-domain-containing protein [Pisolithus microcarpus]|nr:NPL4 family-domain-containing protein [Pisolithus microcarpus]